MVSTFLIESLSAVSVGTEQVDCPLVPVEWSGVVWRETGRRQDDLAADSELRCDVQRSRVRAPNPCNESAANNSPHCCQRTTRL